MDITGKLDVRDISPRVINGWSDVRFEDDETTSADFFEAVKQAIIERASAIAIFVRPANVNVWSSVRILAGYPITQNTLSYEIFDIIEKAIYNISSYFLCGIDDISSSVIGYKYRDDLKDFPFVLEEGNFGVNDDISFFKRPNTMPTWSELKSCGYAYRLVNAINAMTSMKILKVKKIRYIEYGRYFESYNYKIDWPHFVELLNKEYHKNIIEEYLDVPEENDRTDDYGYESNTVGYRLKMYFIPPHMEDSYLKESYSYFPLSFKEVFSAIHPGSGIGADCMLRDVFATYYEDEGDGSYTENIEFISRKKIDPVFCPHDRMIYSPEPHLEINPTFSPSVLPPGPHEAGYSKPYYYLQRFRFNQYYDFGIPGGFRFRKDT